MAGKICPEAGVSTWVPDEAVKAKVPVAVLWVVVLAKVALPVLGKLRGG